LGRPGCPSAQGGGGQGVGVDVSTPARGSRDAPTDANRKGAGQERTQLCAISCATTSTRERSPARSVGCERAWNKAEASGGQLRMKAGLVDAYPQGAAADGGSSGTALGGSLTVVSNKMEHKMKTKTPVLKTCFRSHRDKSQARVLHPAVLHRGETEKGIASVFRRGAYATQGKESCGKAALKICPFFSVSGQFAKKNAIGSQL
jgi:hypothetical protein